MRRRKEKLRDITAEEANSIAAYARDRGDRWKLKLCADWMRANPLDKYPGLYALRNSHGPGWLEGYEVKE